MTKIIINEKKYYPNERDFVANPLEIETETTGVLPGERDTKQTAQETPFASADFTATDVQGALEELFTLSDSNRRLLIDAVGNPLLSTSTYQDVINAISAGKNDVANAIASKNVTATNTMSFGDLATQILLIEGNGNGGSTGGADNLKLTDEIIATANMSYEISIVGYLKPSDSVAQVYKFNDATPSFIHYQNEFNNANSTSFDYDTDVLKFDGMMQIKDVYEYPFALIDDYFETVQIDFSAFVDFENDLVLEDEKAIVYGLKSTQTVAKANGDIPLDEMLEINSVTLSAQGTIRVAVSKNKGFTWQTFDGNNFVDINITDLTAFKENGVTKETLNSISKAQWNSYRQESNVLRFAYFIERATLSDISGTDAIKMDANMAARWLPAPTSDYTQTFDATTQTYNFVFLTAAKYKVRYKE